MPDEPVDLDAIRKNAALEGIPFNEIALSYQELTDEDVQTLREAGVLKDFYDGHRALGSFCADGSVILPEKVTAAYYLGA